MRIHRLILKNFRSHRDSELCLDRLNIIRGTNGAGKTSLQLAIELALTGHNDRTDLAGRGAQILTTVGEPGFTIELLTEDGHITFHRNGGGNNVVVGTHAGKQAYTWIETKIAPLPVLSAVLNSHRFLEMDEREQKALLAGALAAEPVPIDKWVTDLIIKINGSFSGSLRTFVQDAAEVDRIHKDLFNSRTNVNRAIKDYGDLTSPVKPENLPPREEITEQLSDLRQQQTEKVAERERLLAGHKAKKDRLEAAQAQLKQYEPDVLSSDDIDKYTKLAKKRTQGAKLDKEIENIGVEIKAKREAIVGWQTKPTNCDKCGAPLNVDAEELRSKIAVLEVECTNLEKTLTEKRAEKNKLGDPELAQQKLNAHGKAQSPYLRAEQTIREIGEVGDAPDVSQLDEDIKDIAARIPKGEAILSKIDQYEGQVQQHKQVLVKAEKLKEQSAALDKLVEYFSDKGPLKAKLIGGRMPDFHRRINEVLNRFGFECEFEMDPYILTVVQVDDRGIITKPLTLAQLSESQAYRFSIAFQIALAEATGVGLVIIDRCEMLQPEARGQLVQALEESKLEQAIVLATAEPGPAPEIPDVRFFDLQFKDGITSVQVASSQEVTAD